MSAPVAVVAGVMISGTAGFLLGALFSAVGGRVSSRRRPVSDPFAAGDLSGYSFVFTNPAGGNGIEVEFARHVEEALGADGFRAARPASPAEGTRVIRDRRLYDYTAEDGWIEAPEDRETAIERPEVDG